MHMMYRAWGSGEEEPPSSYAETSPRNYVLALQVVGHVKTILVLMGGVVFFGERVAQSQWMG